MIHADDIIEFESSVRRIVQEEVTAALALAGQSHLPNPPWADVNMTGLNSGEITINIDPADRINWPISFVVYPSKQRIELNRLISIFESIELHASFIYEHLRDQNAQDEAMRRVIPEKAFSRVTSNRRSAMRKAVTMRDSACQMAQVLRGEDLDVDPDEEVTGGSRA